MDTDTTTETSDAGSVERPLEQEGHTAANAEDSTESPEEQAGNSPASDAEESPKEKPQHDGGEVQGAGQPGMPNPHNDGGNTLTPAAVAAGPELVARVEVYRDAQGTYYVNKMSDGYDHPQENMESHHTVRQVVNVFLENALAA